MTRNQARKIIKKNAQTKYNNSAMLILLKIVDLTYHPKKDIAERQIEATSASLMKAGKIGDKQLRNVLKQLAVDGVLTHLLKNGRHVSCQLNMTPLMELEPYSEVHKKQRKAVNADRASKAREAREAQHQMSLYNQALGNLARIEVIHQDALLKYFAQGGKAETQEQIDALNVWWETKQKGKKLEERAQRYQAYVLKHGLKAAEEWQRSLDLLDEAAVRDAEEAERRYLPEEEK
jgi:hypothetical protein